MKIGFVGLGKLGKPCAEVFAEQGHEVWGYDIAASTPRDVDIVSSIMELCEKATDFIFIAVPTPHDEAYDGRYPTSHLEPKDFDYSSVKNVLHSLRTFAPTTTPIVLISTVLPGTCRREFAGIMKDHEFFYNPYLIAMGTVKEDFKRPEMIMIGNEKGDRTRTMSKLVDLYKDVTLTQLRFEIGTWEECEGMKIFYNTFISAKVGLVNMIQDVAERIGHMNCDVVAGALSRSDYRITGPAYMKPGMGDGGGCHPRDNIALRWMAQELDLGYDLFDSIMKSREVQAENMADTLVSIAGKLPICILGKSYKPGVEYQDGSYSILVAHYVRTKHEREVIWDKLPNEACAIMLAHPKTELAAPDGSVVLDPWRQVTINSSGVEVYRYGDSR